MLSRVKPAARALVAVGLFLLVSAINILVSPGRIDSIDGQYRIEVSRSLLQDGSLAVNDAELPGTVPGLNGRYAHYPVAGSIVGVPSVWIAGLVGPPSQERQQFFFSFTSAVFGGGIAAVLFLLFNSLQIAPVRAILWTLVSSFATLLFPASATVLDQVQHALVILAACFLLYQSRLLDSIGLAAAAGVLAAFLLNFQESYAVLLPAVGLATLGWSKGDAAGRRRAIQRFLMFGATAASGLLFWGLMNEVRYGSFLFSGRGLNHPPPIGNPVIGIAGLLASPGKSVFLYSPPIILAILGIRGLFRRDRMLALAVVASTLAHLALISSLSFFGGDWCWGPRYLVPILPLMAVALPFANVNGPRRWIAATLVVAGLGVQGMGLTIDHHRFFYERSLPTYFWASDPTFYFRNSALFARPAEIVATLNGVPNEADQFRPGPHPELLTYAVFGEWGHPELSPPEWQRRYRVFWLPRPWIAWMSSVPPEVRPINLFNAVMVVMVIGLAGAAALVAGYRMREVEVTE